MAAGNGRPELPAFQLEVARVFFALPASEGFLLAGGAALLAQHLTARPTEDLDFFTTPDLPPSVTPAGPTFAPEELAGTSSSRCSTGPPHGTSPTSTSWPAGSARTR